MRVLFVLQSIILGGSMTSLINLANILKDNSEFEFDMMFMIPDGALYDSATAVGNVIKTPIILQAVTEKRKNMKGLKFFKLMPLRIFCSVMSKINHISCTEYAYRLLEKKYTNYDVIVAYQEGTATNFVSSISVRKKIAWIHNDYDNVVKIYGNQLEKVYYCFDKIVCVSETGKNNFLNRSNIINRKDKFCRIYNSFDVNRIKTKACEEAKEFINDGVFSLVTVGRIVHQKRFDRLVKVAERLKSEGFRFRWYAIGGGEELELFRLQVIEKKLEECIFFIGPKSNPYAYIAKADIMVITSEFEAHPMVANEALILGTPVITTGYESAYEVVNNMVNGLVCNNSSQGIYDACKTILQNKTLYNKIKNGATTFEYSNDEIKDQVIDIIRDLARCEN